MPFFNLLLISALSMSFFTGEHLPEMPVDTCINLSLEFNSEAGSGGEHTLILKPQGGQAPYKIILSAENGEMLSEDFTKTRYSGIKPGKYICLVVDSNRCMKKIEIQIP